MEKSLIEETEFKDRYGFIKYDIPIVNNIYLIPIDAWNFTNWKEYFSNLYNSVYGIPLNYSKQSFNAFFAMLLGELRDKYKFNNSDIRDFLHFVSVDYMKFLKKTNKIINLNNIKYKADDYYLRFISKTEDNDKRFNIKTRDIILDRDTFDNDLSENIEKYPDQIAKQIGIPFLAYYLIKKKNMESNEAFKLIYSSIKKRMEFELKFLSNTSTYLDDLIWNSIYWGPYPFKEELDLSGFSDWRKTLEWHIINLKYKEKTWWLETAPEREILDIYKKVFKGRKKNNGTKQLTNPKI